MRNRLARLEVDGVDRPRVPVRPPVMRAAPERTDARPDEPRVRIADALPSEKELRTARLARLAVLEHAHADVVAEQLAGECDGRGARADDAHVRLELRRRGQGSAVDDH